MAATEVSSILPVIPIAAAGLAGMLTFITGEKAFWRNLWSTAASLIAFAAILSMVPGALAHKVYVANILNLAGLSMAFRVDDLGLLFAMVSSSMWVLVNLYAIGYMEHEHAKKRFFGFFALSLFSAFGIAFSENLFAFFIFYETLSLCTYPLVVHEQTEEAFKAGAKYLIYTLGGGGVLLVAIIITYFVTGNISLDAPGIFSISNGSGLLKVLFFMYLIGFGVKAAIMPLHHWLPRAMVAPTPVSTLLHAVAVVKAGVFGVLRLIYYIYGVDLMAKLGLGHILTAIAAFTMIAGSLIAINQDNLKRRLAYSTISQLSFIVLAGSLLSPAAALIAMVHIANHAFTKGTLFMSAGIIAEETGVKEISGMKGIAKRLPWTMAIFTIASLGMVGIPPFAGFVSEWFLGVGSVQSGQLILIVAIAVNAILDAVYFFPIIYTAYFDKPDKEWTPARRETTWLMLGPIVATATMTVVLGLFAGLPGLPFSIAKQASGFIYGNWVGATATFGRLYGAFTTSGLPAFAILVPLVGAFVSLWAARHSEKLRNTVALMTATTTFGLVASASFLVVTSHKPVYLALPRFLFGFGLRFAVDPLTVIFAGITSFVWLMATIYSIGYMPHEQKRDRYYFFFLLVLAFNLGVVLAADFFTLFVFFECLGVFSYPLVIHAESGEALKAGTKYMILNIVGGVTLLSGILLLFNYTGSVGLAAPLAQAHLVGYAKYLVGALLIAGFGVKAGMMPLHVWLPDAHPVAPSPASALLSGIMIKAGAYGILRTVYSVYGVRLFGSSGMANWLLALGLIAMILASAVALTQTEIKRLLAYSSVAQMGYIIAGVALLSRWSLTGSIMHVFNHAFMKSLLFFAAGAIIFQTGFRKLEDFRGLGRRMPITMACFTIAAFSMIGIPPLAGFVSKWYLATGATQAAKAGYISSNYALSVVGFLLLSSLLNVLYYGPILLSAWFKAPIETANDGGGHHNSVIKDPNWWMVAPMIVMACAVILFGLWPNAPLSLARSVADGYVALGAVR